MILRILIFFISNCFLITSVFAENGFTVVGKGQAEFYLNFDTLDSCEPHTIEKYTKYLLHGNRENGFLLIKQNFEIGRGCYEGNNPQNISVSAYKVNKTIRKANKPVWEFKTTGIKAEVGIRYFSDLIAIQEKGCCGGGNVKKYYSLNTGNLIACSSMDLLSTYPKFHIKNRFIGVEDNISPAWSYSGDHVAVIYYSSSDEVLQKLILKHPDDKEEWVVDKVEISMIESRLHLTMSFWCRCNAKEVIISIPIFGDKLDIESAILKGSSKMKLVRINNN